MEKSEKIELIEKLVKDESYKPMKIKELAYFLQVPDKDRHMFENIINELAHEGKIYITKKGKITSLENACVKLGTFQGTARNFGFFIPDDPKENEIFIPPDMVNGAMHKDRVLCKITQGGTRTRKDEGVIVKILERGFNTIVGTFVAKKHESYVIPDNKKMTEYIRISKSNSKGAVTGHKVVVELKNKASEKGKLEGIVVDILGHKDDPGVDILSIISQFEIPIDFPPEVDKQLLSIPMEVSESEMADRRDLRNSTTITIDGEDTKDVDDAISLVKLENGNFELSVHIADVTHYVTENSPLDKEALTRGTSVYLVDRVIPMLPHQLSNGICSLNEKVDRLALSCSMEIDNKGIVVNHEIFLSVINVSKKTTYTIVNDLLTNAESEYLEEYADLMEMFKNMKALSHILREKRIQRGAIEFDFPEAKIILDDDGKPISIKSYERNVATSIIEEFMLVCNETIAEDFYWLEAPFVYRTHEEPDPQKIENLIEFIKNFGYGLKGVKQHPKDIQRLLAKVESTPEENIISRIVLRSLKQARYTEENLGHFGLAAKFYCHFTSPIRRYPDLQIHRIIKDNIRTGLPDDVRNHYEKILAAVCTQSSKTERVAEQAEREVESLKKVEFMQDKLFETFEGIISSVVSWGIYVTLPNTIEGMIRTENLKNDRYVFDEKRLEFVGQKHRKVYRLGDKIKVQLIRADIEERKIDFIEYDEDEN